MGGREYTGRRWRNEVVVGRSGEGGRRTRCGIGLSGSPHSRRLPIRWRKKGNMKREIINNYK
jgi:hypothetical protein